ncbi:MAG: efflux RND transporter permease subunit [Planctomycetota bacterium]|nr:efflux RND transporter permease subunit [Planctomycetota bacterium]
MAERGPSLRTRVLDGAIRFSLENKLVVFLLLLGSVAWGIHVAPFDWDLGDLVPRDPVPVDAIPDYGENQQIVFTEWPGRSPQDIEDQVTYPLTASLLGIAGVKTVRSYSYLGFSTIYVIFKEDVEFYWSRDRLLEKLASLPESSLPEGVRPVLGPDATPLGQIFWYTLEGRDPQGDPAGGWDLEELRSIQDWQVRYALMGVDGVSEVASVGGFVREYQIDVDPDAMRAHGVRLDEVFEAVRLSNIDVGARTIEVNRVEYVIRSLGFLKSVEDIEETVIKVSDNIPLRIRDVAHVSEGPALRRGALDKEGEEAVGGVVVVRYRENPLAAIRRLKEKIQEISEGLPRRVLPDGTVSQVTIVPFYDRTELIHETLETLNTALFHEILVTIIVVLLMLRHLRSSILISGLLPVAVLLCFVAMKQFEVDANVVALTGIAIAIGTMVDMGIVLAENILRRLQEAEPEENRLEVVYRASTEVGSAVLTAILTTVVSFLPVFAMEEAAGKLFRPLAYTKTFALVASVVVALGVIPPVAHVLLASGIERRRALRVGLSLTAALVGLWLALGVSHIVGSVLGGAIVLFSLWNVIEPWVPATLRSRAPRVASGVVIALVLGVLTQHWLPLGPDKGFLRNLVFVGGLLGAVFGVIALFHRFYEPLLRWCLAHRALFLALPLGLGVSGLIVAMKAGREFMPYLSEGTFLFMPSTSPHASIGESLDALRKQDMAIRAIPEVDLVVGKIGRVESPLDPAPVSMMETIVQYKPEYILDENGHRKLFRVDEESGEFARDAAGELVPDPSGRPYRQWRDTIRSEDDIWREIERAGRILGSTGAAKLQPIETRLIMLQTGMRAPLGVKVYGPDLESIERAGLDIERLLRELSSIVKPKTVRADRIVGKPYQEIHIDRRAIARYGISVRRVQDVIEVAIGGRTLTTTVEGRARYPVRVRYLRELRDNIESFQRILVPAPDGTHVPLGELAEVRYKRGPMEIKAEDTRLVGYVTFDRQPDVAEVDAVEAAAAHLERALDDGRLSLPSGVSYRFAGTYENQVRSAKKLLVLVPVTLLIIFVILYLQFRSVLTTQFVFSGVLVAWSGGFLMLWLYGQDWFLDFSVFGENLRDLFRVRPYNLSTAVWVGFLALFGIASDDGVIMATYLDQSFAKRRPATRDEVREAVVAAGKRRIRPCLMTVATTILALIPVLTATGRGADVMVPMAIPTFGGMCVALITVLIVPTLYAWREEWRLGR